MTKALSALPILCALSLACTLALPRPAAAQESALSKSITSGWKSVVKETSKAAKSVSKAANEALTPAKPKRRKSAKRKTEADTTAEAKPETAATPVGAPSAANETVIKKRTPQSPSDDGPPVPLAKPDPPPAGEPVIRKEATPAKRLPPPPPHNTQARGKPAPAEGGWTASTSDGKPPQAAKLPAAEAVPADGEEPHGTGGKPLPITMIPPKPADPAVQATGWSKEEIEAAKANCAALLKSVDAVTIPEAPVREGNCGAPAPVRLVSIGKNPEVALSPPPLVTCELVAGLHQWMKNDIQPLSKRHFGSPVIKIETMSDYSCRMAYGRKGNKLSEHGRANALDIRGFITAKGETAHVLEQWGKTARDRAAEATALAAQKAAAENAARAAAAAGSKSAVEGELADAKVSVALTADAPRPAVQASLAPASKKQAEIEKAAAAIVPDAPRSKKALFLHDAHTAACKIFGTSLGPESNEAHRNHFHVDMAERRRTKICE